MKFLVLLVALVVLVTAQDNRFKTVCYFTNWSWYRNGDGKFTPANINPKLCTHIVYAFAVLDDSSLTMKIHDQWADVDNHLIEQVTAYRKQGIRVSIALGGWNDSVDSKYGRLLASQSARQNFITSAISFIQKYNFEGLDLDLEVR